ncbi:cryptococcal mannosyltransferase 1-domain-containing protein [Mycena amicta]|nr:cryptococcal mannosyltransferase 1-domain-containing protein [Mycena amicta]
MAALYNRHPSLTIFLLSVLSITIFRIFTRFLFITALVALPSWGFCMCLMHFYNAAFPRKTLESEAEHKVAQPARSPLKNKVFVGEFALVLLGFYLLYTLKLPQDHRFSAVVQEANRAPRRDGYSGEKVFIAALFHNNAEVIPYWTEEMLQLINYLGPDNVFISIVESYSTDASPPLLLSFASLLTAQQIPHRVLVQDTTIPKPADMRTAHPRINFLASTRNLAMEPLLNAKTEEEMYDRVLFSNDVFVKAESMVELLNTRDGEYSMACGMDFQEWGLYDLWVTRDLNGGLVSNRYPYFLEPTAFHAVLASEPVPVSACWNGIVSITSDPFLPPHLRLLRAQNRRLSDQPLLPLPSSHPLYPRTPNETPLTSPQLTFRPSSVSRGECFSSESFNLPYDLQRVFELDRIFMNPRVVTAYKWRFYIWFKYVLRHWAVRWWMRRVEVAVLGNGKGLEGMRDTLEKGKVVLYGNDPRTVWRWDGGDCHPGPFPRPAS